MKKEKDYLISTLQAAGIKSHVYTTMKELSYSNEAHVAAVLRVNETFTISGSKTNYRDQRGTRKRRRKYFDRQTILKVVIGDVTEKRCEETLEKFLLLVGKGVPVDGNWVDIEIGEADWVEDKDSIIKAKIAVEFQVTFHGGIYKDSVLSPKELGQIRTEHGRENHE